jgi:TonB family protein
MMTDATRFRAALGISFFAHFMLLHAPWTSVPDRMGKTGQLSREMMSSSSLFSEEIGIAIEDFVESASPDGKADKLQEERRLYLEAVSGAIHARRFVSAQADRDLIGLASFSFTIMPDGSFQGIALARSSGNPLLDRAAEAAVRDASGIVKRPLSLEQEMIDWVAVVKYQYEW